MPTAAFTTLGCKVNQYETQRILDSFEGAGFEVVPFGVAADVYVINTCSSFLGRTMSVLVEVKMREGPLHGLADNGLDVRFAGSPTLTGVIVYCTLSGWKDDSLFGEQAPTPASHRTPLAVRV